MTVISEQVLVTSSLCGAPPGCDTGLCPLDEPEVPWAWRAEPAPAGREVPRLQGRLGWAG